MITLNHVQKQFGSKILFKDCSLQIGARDRIGLIGPNGSGKTTLFRMVLGEEPIDGGEILIAKGVKMGYLPQEVISLRGSRVLEEVLRGASGITSLQDKMKILEEELSTIEDPEGTGEAGKGIRKTSGTTIRSLEGMGLEAEAKRILHGLGFKERDFQRPTDELSGGWLMRIALAKILLQSPDLLLLDEPTNHLDLESLIWLEEFLTNYPGAIVIVSHDRTFLNHLVDRIAEIEVQKIDLYPGDYDHYLEEKEARRRILEATYTPSRRRSSRPRGLLNGSGTRIPRPDRSRAGSGCSRNWSGLNFRGEEQGSPVSVSCPEAKRSPGDRGEESSQELWRSEGLSGNRRHALSGRQGCSRRVRTGQGSRPFSRSWPVFSILKRGRWNWERM